MINFFCGFESFMNRRMGNRTKNMHFLTFDTSLHRFETPYPCSSDTSILNDPYLDTSYKLMTSMGLFLISSIVFAFCFNFRRSGKSRTKFNRQLRSEIQSLYLVILQQHKNFSMNLAMNPKQNINCCF